MKRRVLSLITALALCLGLCPVQAWAAGMGTDGNLCPHHSTHTDECGYVEGDPDSPCTFVCRICPIDSLIGKLPDSVSADNIEQVYAQLSEIYDLYDELTADEQEQVDLSPCLSLQDQIDGMSAETLDDDVYEYTLDSDKNYTSLYKVSKAVSIDTSGYTLSGSNSSAIQVTGTGELYLMGTVTSQKGAGVEVLSGGFLNVMAPGTATFITGTTYGLDVASGARVQLSAGTYTGGSAAIRTADGDFAALLAPGCAYFDAAGNPILPASAGSAATLVVGTCVNHSSKSYAHSSGATEHVWTCLYCGTTETEPCTFSFDQNGRGTCVCGNSLTITVDERDLTDLVYDGTIKPEDVEITVALADGSGKELVKDADYTVDYEPRSDAGEITVTVTGITFNGTFTKIYNVEPDEPGITWDETTAELDYDGRRTTIKDELPNITITLEPANNEDLHQYLQYSYRSVGDTAFTDGLPLDVGEYEIKAYIPESQNYIEAETDPLLTLTIKAIDPIAAAPIPAEPTYNGGSQELVTAGVVDSRAVGAEILFATSENGTYSTAIPTGVNAGDYEVWYKVEGTHNYNAVPPTQISGVKILRKEITPIVTLSEYKYLYDGGWKEPTVTVKDVDDVTILLDTEYQVEYVNNRNVSTDGNPAKAVVTDKTGGNYQINRTEVEFKITLRPQETLSITDKPDSVTYGDRFTLSTLGGSGNGDVTWEITDGSDVAEVDPASGQITIIGDGSATVQATKSGKDPVTNVANYEDATASWTFTADKKPVVATVTAEDKIFDGDNIATVHAVVEQGVLPGDKITIEDLPGTFSDENAGVDKTVTVDTSNPAISGINYEHYDVSFSSATVKGTIHKATPTITTVPAGASLTYNGTAQALVASGAVVNPSSVRVEYSLSEDGPYSTDFPKGTDAGRYTVWYRVVETGNYTGLAPAHIDVEIGKKPVAPTITLSGDGLVEGNDGTYSYVYDGAPKEPTVTLTETDGTIPADQYTVAYSNNINVSTDGNPATVTVTAKPDGNYSFTPVQANFTIGKEKAQVLTAPMETGDPLVYSARAQKLVTAGAGLGGEMVYRVGDQGEFSPAIPTGLNAGTYTVYYKVAGDGNHSDSDVGSVDVTIAPKPVEQLAIELLNDDDTPFTSCVYDGTAQEPAKVVVKDGSTEIADNEYTVVYRNNTDAGEATVHINDNPNGNYIVTGSTTFVIQKANIVFTKDPEDAKSVYDGKAHELVKPGTTSGGTVMYALGSATSTYTDAIPTATEAGTYTVYYKVVGDKNHNDFEAQPVTATIARKPLTEITIELSPRGFKYDGTEKLPEITVKDGETVLPAREYEWSCSDTSPKDVGTYTITITDAPDGNYDLSGVTQNTADFTIGKTEQAELVIDHSDASTTNYGDTFVLTVTGGSGNGAVTWEVDGPATINNGNVTIKGVGEVTITAEKAADTNYLSAEAQWTFTAAPKPVTASITVGDRDYDGTTDATVVSANIAVLPGDTVTITPASIIATFDSPTAGTGKAVTLDTSKVQVSGDMGKYAISYPDTVTADITQATTEITTDPAKIDLLEYTGEPQALITAGKTNVGFLMYSLDGTSFSPEIPTGTDAGTYKVYYKVDGTGDYTEIAVNTANPISVTIVPKTITPTIELSETSYVYDGSKKEPKITVKDGNTVIDQVQYTVTWADDGDPAAADVLTAAGTYTATIANVTSGNNYTFSQTVAVEIVPAPQAALNITGKPAHVYYGDTITTLSATGGSGSGTVTWSITTDGSKSTINPATGELSVKDAGSITVKAERTVPNHETVSDTWVVAVEPKPITAEVTITGKTYDGSTTIADADISAAVDPSDLVDPADSITISGLKGSYVDAKAGTDKAVTLDDTAVTITADSAKYTVSCPGAATADITPRAVNVTVTLSDHDLQTDNDGSYYYVFDGGEKKPAVTVEGVDGAYSATLEDGDYTAIYADNKNVGKATVTVKSAAGGNYTFADETVQFEIKPAVAQLTKSPEAKVLAYTGAMQELVTVGTAEGGHVEYALDGGAFGMAIPEAKEAGTYIVTYKAVGDGNYEDSAVVGSVSVTIAPKEIVSPKITVSGAYTYNGKPQEPGSANVTVEDGTTTIPNTEYTLTYSNNVNAGTATVHVIDVNGGNYTVNGTATFTIEKGNVSVTKAPESIENLPYNGAPQELVTAGEAANGTMVYSFSQEGPYSPVIPTGTAVKVYEIWYMVQGGSNYNDTTPAQVGTDASIIVNNVTAPTIQVAPESVTYNGKRQEPVVTVKDDNGLLIDGSEYTVTYAAGDGNQDLTKAGEYTITIKNISGSNYIINDSSKQFTILPANQTPLTITNTREHVYYGDTIQLGTTGGSDNGTVTWAVDGDPSIASIDNNGLLTITGVGSVTVKATCSAANYDDQTATWPLYADKKPVTAVVTAASKPYDGNTPATTTVTATLQKSDLVGSDAVTITLTGAFEDANAGTDKKVKIDSTNPDFTGSTGNYGNYNITYPDTTTASIFKADIDTTDPTQVIEPTLVTGPLEYTGNSLNLVNAGSSTVGTVEYSPDNRTYSAGLPTGIDAGDYDVWYRVKGDSNHNDTDGEKLGTVTISPQDVAAPIIEFTPSGASYDGAVHKPSVTVMDKYGRVIPSTEYTVAYGTGDWIKAGDYTVTVTDKAGGNYKITTATEKFTILVMGQNPLSIVNQPSRVQYGDTFTLSAIGGSGTGTIQWQVTTGAEFANIDQNGRVTLNKSGGPVTITATRLADGNYGAASVTWTFSVEKKPVTAIVTAEDREYVPGNTTADLVITWKPGDLLGNDTINLDGILAGAFDNANVGNNKTVRITVNGSLPDSDKYAISYNTTTTASITPAAATVTAPTPIQGGLTYNGSSQRLVNAGSAANGTIYYSLDGVNYGPNIPEGKNAGTYTVWYKAVADENYKDSAPDKMDVTIAPKPVNAPTIELSPMTFDYDGAPKKPEVVVKDGNNVIPASEYTVSYSDNVAAGSATVTISDAGEGNYAVATATASFTIKAGAAVLTLAPEEKTLTYTGTAQSLVRAGTAVNGQVVYSLTGDEDDYSPSIPKETDAGTYTVWYKVRGNEGYTDTVADSVTVTIQPKPVTPVITLTLTNDPMIYTGSPLKPGVTVKVEGKTLDGQTDYIVTYSSNTNPGTATVTVQSASGINYQFRETAAFEIAKSKAVFAVEPKGINSSYTGKPQELIEKYTGTSLEGTVLYSLNAVTYSAEIPTGTDVRTYTIYAKIQGDSKHDDSEIKIITAAITQNTVENPTVELSSNSFTYTGSAQKPTITLTDDGGNVIPTDEYRVTYTGDTINPGTYKLTITSKGINYSFDPIDCEITITAADQPALTITGKPERTIYYGDTFQLGVSGGSGDGAVTWGVSGPADKLADGQFEITGSGSVTIMVTKAASGSYKAATDTWTFYAYPKPLAVTVTAADRAYAAGDTTVSLTVAISASDWVSSGDVEPITAKGHFADENVGTNKTVFIDELEIPAGISGKYSITHPATTTASITPAAAKVTASPTVSEGLTYTGRPQTLLTDGGQAEGGNLAYSLDGVNYSFNIPMGTEAGEYTVWYKVIAGSENYTDSAPAKTAAVEIAVNTGTPSVKCSPDSFQYDGTVKTPTIVVLDDAGREIPASEYTVTYPEGRIATGEYTVTVTDKQDGNYEFSGQVTGTFEIVAASQNPLSIVTDIPTNILYGDTFRLSAIGGSGDGAIVWKIKGTVAEINDDGVVTVIGTGGFTVEAYREGADGYSDSNTASVAFTAEPKPITPIVTAEDKPYDGNMSAALHATWKNGDLVNGDTLPLTVGDGQFASKDVGTNKRVTIQPGTPSGDIGNYIITWPDSTTASIYKVDAELETLPEGSPSLTYTGGAQALVTAGKTKDDIGTIVYSLDQNGVYSKEIPTATDAGTYFVWYKVADSMNHMGIDPASIKVEIGKATPTITTDPTASGTKGQKLSEIELIGGQATVDGTEVPGTFAWTDGTIEPAVGTHEYEATFTPKDIANYNKQTVNVAVTVTDPTGGDSTDSTGNSGGTGGSTIPPVVTPSEPDTMKTTIQNGTASTVLSAAGGSKLVKEAVANQSQNVVIKPEITGDVTRTEVSIPASTVGQIGSETNAALTVSAPIADVTIPNAALDTLSQAGGAVNVMTEQTEQSVVLTLTADNKTVESVPGGLTLTVPVEDAGPGTVAVLVNEDGTRETIRKSVVEDGRLSIPLDGSATVEIVDNSKDFADVPSTNWAADAIDFASAHELFNGTSETTFSPDQAMSRGMLATVLYNLEGQPDQDQTCTFGDVSGDAWYADGVSWAAANGITNGYSDGQFGPNDSITREQFAVMLWRYAGSPETNGGNLGFTDANQASDYALEALRWATENGILNGYGDGRLDPNGMATRAQAAQMLKNFMENT